MTFRWPQTHAGSVSFSPKRTSIWLHEVRSLIAELRNDLGDLPEMRSNFENVEGEAAVCAASPFGNYQVRQAVTGDVAPHRHELRIGVVLVKGSDDESFAALGDLLSIDGPGFFENFEIRVVRGGRRIEIGLRDVGTVAS